MTDSLAQEQPRAAAEGAPSPLGVFWIFLRLGLTAFGGPVAHLGYFRSEFVVRRRWLAEDAYADLVALCQFLPGPASSQVGFSIGLIRAGYLGGAAAWLGFTLPSAVLMTLFALGSSSLADTAVGASVMHGLKLVAVAIVAQAVWGMARTLCPDRTRAAIATAALAVALLAPVAAAQVSAIGLGAVAGGLFCRTKADAAPAPLTAPVGPRVGAVAVVLFAALLTASLLVRGDGIWAFLAAVYRSGALVFGGGHVVLPLLDAAVVRPGWVSPERFLQGYGAAQAMPGPLFTFAAYLGAVATPAGGWIGAAAAVVAIFAPGILLQTGALPYWVQVRSAPGVQALMKGVNASVVGIIGAAFYTPVFTGGINSRLDIVIATSSFVGLTALRLPAWLIVIFTTAASVGTTVLLRF